MEIWKEAPSLPGLEVSTYGRLRVTPYETTMPSGATRRYGGYESHGQWDGTRYIYRFRGKTYKVARLICETFNGPPLSPIDVCMHMDENSANNKSSNLEWGTQKQNLNAPGFIEHCRGRVGNKNPRVKGRRRALMNTSIRYPESASSVFQT